MPRKRPHTTTQEQLVYTSDEAARLIHPDLAPRTLERWRRNGSGPAYVKIGRRVGYTRAAIEAWMATRTYRQTADEQRRKR